MLVVERAGRSLSDWRTRLSRGRRIRQETFVGAPRFPLAAGFGGRRWRARDAAPAAGEDELLAGLRLRTILRRYSDHITVPILMKKETWDATAKKELVTDEDEQINQASALWARSKSEITRGAVPRVLQARRARLRAAAGARPRQGRRPPGIHAAVLHSAAGAIRPVGPRPSPRHQALRPARLHHGRCRGPDAGVPALRARRHRLERPAAQRVARDPAAVARRPEHPYRIGQARARPARGPRDEPAGKVRHLLEDLRPRAEGRRGRRHRQPRSHRQAAAVRVDARRHRRADGVAGRLRRAG